MAKIDSRIVSIRLSNEGFQKQANDTIKSMKDLNKATADGLGNINSTAAKTNLKPVVDSTEEVSKSFGAMSIVAIAALATITAQAVSTGADVIKNMSITKVLDGWKEYELQINAVQTILSNTSLKGTTMAEVEAHLDMLNDYADKTKYNFGEMTANLGKFTAAGVGLTDSTNAIKGLANVAAMAGTNSIDASRGMYQLSQAIAAGTVRAQDWMSIQNAGMGGEVFQEAIKQTARVHGVAVDDMIANNGGFKQSLKDDWLTTEIMLETLSKFTGDLNDEQLLAMGYTAEQVVEIQKLAQTAVKAATEIKTLTDLFGTMKEQSGSGWAKSFSIIVGNYEEAQAIFTELGEIFTGSIQKSSDFRNAILKDWANLGGRAEIFTGIKNIIMSVFNTLGAVRDAFRDVFPPRTGQQLFDMSVGFRKLTEKLMVTEEKAGKIRRTLVGVFSIVRIVTDVIGLLVKGFVDLLGLIPSTNFSLLDLTAKMGDNATAMSKNIDMTEIYNSAVSRMKDAIVYIKVVLKDFGTQAKQIYEDVSKVVGEATDHVSLDRIVGGLQAGLLSGILVQIYRIYKNFADMSKSGGGMLKSITKILDSVRGCFEAWQTKLKAEALKTIAIAIGIITLSIIGLSMIEPTKLAAALAGLTAAMGSLLVFMKIFTKIDVKDLNGMVKSMAGMILLAVAIAILAGVVKKLGELPIEVAQRGAVGLAVILGMVTVMFKVLSGISINMTGVLGLSLGIFVLSHSVVLLGKIDIEKGKQGAIGLTVILTLIALFMKIVDKVSVTGLGSIIALSAAILLLVGAISILGNLKPETIIQGLGALMVLMAGLTVALVVLSATEGSVLKSAAAIAVLAIALGLLVPSIVTLGLLPLAVIVTGLAAIAGILVVFGLAGLVLKPVAGTLMSISTALLVFGAGVFAVGAGVLMLATGLTALSLIVGVIGPIITAFIASIVSAIPAFVAAIALGFVQLLAVIAANTPSIVTSVITIVSGILAAIVVLAPQMILAFTVFLASALEAFIIIMPLLMEALGVLVTSILDFLILAIPRMATAGMEILLGILTGIRDNIFQIVVVAGEIIVNFLEGIAAKLPDIIIAAIDVLLSFINGFANGIREKAAEIKAAIQNLFDAMLDAFNEIFGINALMDWGKSIIDGVAKGISGAAGKAVQAVKDVAGDIADGFTSFLGINSPSRLFAGLSGSIPEGVAKGIRDNTKLAVTAVGVMARSTVDQANNIFKKGTDPIVIIPSIEYDDTFSRPTIRPVLDLTEVNRESKKINLNDKTINGINIAKKGVAASSLLNYQLLMEKNQNNKPAEGTSIVYNQTINSPKEINRLDVYRDTQNILRLTKG